MAKSDFEAGEWIIKSYDITTRGFIVKEETSEGADDGTIKFGSVVTAVEARIYSDIDGTDVTSQMLIGLPNIDDNIIYIKLQYPDEVSEDGRYRVNFKMTIDDDSENRIEVDFREVYCIVD